MINTVAQKSKKGGSLEAANNVILVFGLAQLTHCSRLQVSRTCMKGKLGLVDKWTRALSPRTMAARGLACHHSGSSPGRKTKPRQRYHF